MHPKKRYGVFLVVTLLCVISYWFTNQPDYDDDQDTANAIAKRPPEDRINAAHEVRRGRSRVGRQRAAVPKLFTRVPPHIIEMYNQLFGPEEIVVGSEVQPPTTQPGKQQRRINNPEPRKQRPQQQQEPQIQKQEKSKGRHFGNKPLPPYLQKLIQTLAGNNSTKTTEGQAAPLQPNNKGRNNTASLPLEAERPAEQANANFTKEMDAQADMEAPSTSPTLSSEEAKQGNELKREKPRQEKESKSKKLRLPTINVLEKNEGYYTGNPPAAKNKSVMSGAEKTSDPKSRPAAKPARKSGHNKQLQDKRVPLSVAPTRKRSEHNGTQPAAKIKSFMSGDEKKSNPKSRPAAKPVRKSGHNKQEQEKRVPPSVAMPIHKRSEHNNTAEQALNDRSEPR